MRRHQGLRDVPRGDSRLSGNFREPLPKRGNAYRARVGGAENFPAALLQGAAADGTRTYAWQARGECFGRRLRQRGLAGEREQANEDRDWRCHQIPPYSADRGRAAGHLL